MNKLVHRNTALTPASRVGAPIVRSRISEESRNPPATRRPRPPTSSTDGKKRSTHGGSGARAELLRERQTFSFANGSC
ncbi:hypothetical protein EVAR_92096_1 [Eumeta japonica]|uniref:Uncharacterized protein n=1 Tax=Eumeta variegata TaxID=151549 RepID=A0A4C1SZ77_EUMVA|nr:hypothetical protein EVAR_92096_1 [Eumeta japonica]